MEILNNLWVALSTPNESLLNVILIPLIVVENFLIMELFIAILNLKNSVKQKLIYTGLMTIISLLSMYFIPSPFNIFFNYIAMIAIAFLTFKISFLKSTASIVASAIAFNIVNSLLLNPYLTILGIGSQELVSIPVYRIFYLIVVYLLVTLIIFIIKYRHVRFTFLDNINKKTKIIIFLNLLLGIIAIVIQSITLFYYIDLLPLAITFLSTISLLVYFIISMYSITRIFKLILTTQKLESAEEYNHTLRVLHDSVRGFKHDFDNIVTTIGGFIRTNDMEGLKNYYVELEDDCQRVNNLYVLNPEIVNNDGIYNLLTKKYHEADSKDIKVTITFLLDLSTLNMKIYEFARILGILLDNAIEASSECEEKIINIDFRNDPKNSRQIIKIENTYKNKDIDTDKIFEKGVSEKENHTGLGLWEVRKLIKKNNNINLFTSKNEKFFVQQLEIYY